MLSMKVFIQKANSFKSSIWVEKDDRRVNAKSLLGVLSLGIVKGMTITLIADGIDEAEALEELHTRRNFHGWFDCEVSPAIEESFVKN